MEKHCKRSKMNHLKCDAIVLAKAQTQSNCRDLCSNRKGSQQHQTRSSTSNSSRTAAKRTTAAKQEQQPEIRAQHQGRTTLNSEDNHKTYPQLVKQLLVEHNNPKLVLSFITQHSVYPYPGCCIPFALCHRLSVLCH